MFFISRITHSQKLIAISIILLSVLLLVLFYFLADCKDYTTIIPTIIISVCASAIYSLLYSALAKNIECEEIAIDIVSRFTHVFPKQVYRVGKNENFKSDLIDDLRTNFSNNIYYEGVTIKTFCLCLKEFITGSDINAFPNIYIIISKADALEKKEFEELLCSLICLYELCKNNIGLKFTFCIINDICFHIHLTDNNVWFSPFKGNHPYPTTFLYPKSIDTNSYYTNLRCMLDKFINKNDKNLYVLNNNPDNEKSFIGLLNKLGIKQYIKKNRYLDIKKINDQELIQIVYNIKNETSTVSKRNSHYT